MTINCWRGLKNSKNEKLEGSNPSQETTEETIEETEETTEETEETPKKQEEIPKAEETTEGNRRNHRRNRRNHRRNRRNHRPAEGASPNKEPETDQGIQASIPGKIENALTNWKDVIAKIPQDEHFNDSYRDA